MHGVEEDDQGRDDDDAAADSQQPAQKAAQGANCDAGTKEEKMIQLK